MHLMFLGPPGSGKGTQSKVLEKELNAVQVATGDILRTAVKNKTELGKKAKEFMDAGKYVPDELIIDLVREKFSDPSFSDNWIVDGFPRTVNQAKAFDKILNNLSKELDLVIEINLNRGLLVKRITGRRVCKNCQAPYHTEFNPTKVEGTCDYCGSTDIYQRSDDKEDVVIKRLEEYDNLTFPLIEYYKSKGKLKVINGDQDVKKVTEDILSLIK